MRAFKVVFGCVTARPTAFRSAESIRGIDAFASPGVIAVRSLM